MLMGSIQARELFEAVDGNINPIDDAYEDLLIKANEGDSRAQYLIGCFYYFGGKVESNHAIASQWFIKSANQNLVDAQTILGYQYMYGDGILKDIDKAMQAVNDSPWGSNFIPPKAGSWKRLTNLIYKDPIIKRG